MYKGIAFFRKSKKIIFIPYNIYNEALLNKSIIYSQ
jgi:hypothetical protein